MKRLLGGALALLLMGQAPPPARVSDLGWMAGSWSVQDAGGRWTEERWTPPRGGMMLGVARVGRWDRVDEFEFLRLQAGEDGVPVYYAQPGGRPPVAFRLISRDATSATFENPTHDFPQRIRYVRDGDLMTATISRLDGSNAMSWRYSRR